MSLTYGIGEPSPSLGNEGDEYINREDGGLWCKVRAEHSLERLLAWQKFGEVPVGVPGPKGEKGEPGAPGSIGPQGATGSPGTATVDHIEIAVFGGW